MACVPVSADCEDGVGATAVQIVHYSRRGALQARDGHAAVPYEA